MVPDGDMEVTKRKSRRNRFSLKVDTREENLNMAPSTPDTAASTPATTPAGRRGNSDIRSPGEKKSPRAHVDGAPVPDFITQTDKDGNAITPRTEAANNKEAEQHIASGNLRGDEVDADHYESLLDSIRQLCCCLPTEEKDSGASSTSQATHLTSGSLTESRAGRIAEKKTGILPPIHPDDGGKKCLVLDLDETLVHSSFQAVAGADFVIPVQIEDVVHFVYVAKRPGVDEFLLEMSKHYEIVIYTASLNKYADPLLDLLDPQCTIRSRLFRESCVYYDGSYVKDLSLLDRDLSQAIIVDNSPNSYIFHPDNAIDCSSFIDDPNDRELDQIGAFLTGIKDVKDVRGISRQWKQWPNVNIANNISSIQ